MNEIERLKSDSQQWALSEIEKYGFPSKLNFETSNKKGQELAEVYGLNKDLVLIGTTLMDIKLGEAKHLKQLKEHIQMGVDEVKLFLKKYSILDKEKEIILNSVKFHHGTDDFKSKEAEICANADCYRFLEIENVFDNINSSLKNGLTFKDAISHARDKMDEKFNILTLNECITELKPNYDHFTALFNKELNKN